MHVELISRKIHNWTQTASVAEQRQQLCQRLAIVFIRNESIRSALGARFCGIFVRSFWYAVINRGQLAVRLDTSMNFYCRFLPRVYACFYYHDRGFIAQAAPRGARFKLRVRACSSRANKREERERNKKKKQEKNGSRFAREEHKSSESTLC